MKVLIDLTSLADNFSGIERFALSITKSLLDINCDERMQYILMFKNGIHTELQNKKDDVEYLILHGKNKLLFNQFILPKALWRIQADCYFFPAFPAPFFFFNKHAISAIHDLGCWDCPGKNKKHMNAYFKLMYWKAAFGKKKVVTVSEFTKGRIASILRKNLNEIKVIYDGLSECFEQFRYDKQQDEKAKAIYELPEKYILCLSTLEPRKNLRLLIEAYDQLLREKKTNLNLVLAGRKGWGVDGLLDRFGKSTIERIRFAGFVEEPFLPYVYKNAALFVFPSVYEGFGIPPIEALAMGIPVISSDAASLPEVLGDVAFYFQSNDITSLKNQILHVLSFDQTTLAFLKEKARRQVMKFNWNAEAKKLKDIVFAQD